jgi:hypothetical protein
MTCSVMDVANTSVAAWPAVPMTTAIAGLHSGETLDIQYLSGSVNLNQSVWPLDFFFNPDGSLVYPNSTTDWSTPSYQYNYMKPGYAYPTAAGGDGINHFSGGGANYDAYYSTPDTPWGFYFSNTFAHTTDTTRADAVRFGSLIGTLDWGASWFYIGYGRTIGAGTDIPIVDGATLNLAAYDADYGAQNSGVYQVFVSDVPEPSAILLPASGLAARACLRRRRK